MFLKCDPLEFTPFVGSDIRLKWVHVVQKKMNGSQPRPENENERKSTNENERRPTNENNRRAANKNQR
jgi:hypothetical protein